MSIIDLLGVGLGWVIIGGFVSWAAHFSRRRESRLLRRVATAVAPFWAGILMLDEFPLPDGSDPERRARLLATIRTVSWYVSVLVAAAMLAALAFVTWRAISPTG